MEGRWIRHSKSGLYVVFIHGLFSSGDSCWSNSNGSYWPNLLTYEKDLDEIGIYVFTYQTNFFSGNFDLSDVVDSLKVQLGLDNLLDGSDIVFVCHSMGGIVARKYIVERVIDLIELNIKIGLFLIASPSLGSDYANWFIPIIKLFGHSQAETLRFREKNLWLKSLDKEFQNLKSSNRLRIVGKELVEDKFIVLKKFWFKQVVEPFAGARYFGESFKVPNSDHFSIATPKDENAIQHRILCKFIVEFAQIENSKSTDTVRTRVAQTDDAHYSDDSDKNPLKYFVYLSKIKIEMLFTQITRVPEESHKSFDHYRKLHRITGYLKELKLLGSVDDPKEYFYGELDLKWGPYADSMISTNQELVYFGGSSDRTIVGLGGSIKHLVGSSGESSPHSHSAMPAIIDVIEKELDIQTRDKWHPNFSTYSEQEKNVDALRAVHLATTTMNGSFQKMEFIAKRLIEGASPYPHRDKRLGMKVLLGTPIYVALAE